MELAERFLKLVSFDTTSDEAADCCPSTPSQLALARETARAVRTYLPGVRVVAAALRARDYVKEVYAPC